MARNVGEVAHDMITLAELQYSLLRLDAIEWLNRSKIAIILLVVGGIVALGTMPVLLATLAYTIFDLTSLPLSASFGIAALTGLLAAGLLGILGYRTLVRAPNVFSRSQNEWSNNLNWVKQSFRHADTDAPHYSATGNGTSQTHPPSRRI